MHEVLVNRLGGLSLPRKSVVRLTDHPDMTLDPCLPWTLNNNSSVIRQSFFLPKQSQRSRSLGLLRKGKIGIIAKFHRTDLVI